MHTHIFNKRVRMLCRRSRSLSLREYFVDQTVVVVRSLLFFFSLLFFLSPFFSDKFRVLKSKALFTSRLPVGETDFTLYFSTRNTHAHTQNTKQKKNAIHDRPKSLRVRARPENDETGEKERFKYLFLVHVRVRAWISPIFFFFSLFSRSSARARVFGENRSLRFSSRSSSRASVLFGEEEENFEEGRGREIVRRRYPEPVSFSFALFRRKKRGYRRRNRISSLGGLKEARSREAIICAKARSSLSLSLSLFFQRLLLSSP